MSWIPAVSSLGAGSLAATVFYKTYDSRMRNAPRLFTAFAFGCNIGVATWCCVISPAAFGLAMANVVTASFLWHERRRRLEEDYRNE
jgi:hypothetical protein